VPAGGEQLGIAGARTPLAPSLAETKPQTRPFGSTRGFSHPQSLFSDAQAVKAERTNRETPGRRAIRLSGVDRRPRSSESPQDSFRRNNPPLDSSVRIESPAIPQEGETIRSGERWLTINSLALAPSTRKDCAPQVAAASDEQAAGQVVDGQGAAFPGLGVSSPLTLDVTGPPPTSPGSVLTMRWCQMAPPNDAKPPA
jgi:hypothetical protein